MRRKSFTCSARANRAFTASTSACIRSCTGREAQSEAKSENGTRFSCAKRSTFSWSIMMRAVRYLRPSPITTASEIQGENFIWFSVSAGVMFLPPAVMMMSLMRPVIQT